MPQSAKPGATGRDDPEQMYGATAAKPVRTPTRKAPDPITGRSEPDNFYALGGQVRSLDAQLRKEANKRKNPSR